MVYRWILCDSVDVNGVGQEVVVDGEHGDVFHIAAGHDEVVPGEHHDVDAVGQDELLRLDGQPLAVLKGEGAGSSSQMAYSLGLT